MKLFDMVSFRRPKTSMFNLTHERKLSCNMGQLIPILVQEVLPGDKFRVSSELIARFAPMLAPMMHRVDAFVHYFFVPNRLVWSEWQDFITGGRDGLAAPVHPTMTMDTTVTAALVEEGSLYDHMGLPPYNPAAVTSPPSISALPFRAYQTVYDEYFRDQNLEAPIAVSTASGVLNSTERTKCLTMRTRAWEKDYFTSALPWAQRGNPVTVPVSGTGSVTYKSTSDVRTTAGAVAAANLLIGTIATAGIMAVEKTGAGVNGQTGRIENIQDVQLSNASILVNDLRTAIHLQEWSEKNAVGGGRYNEQILAHFGIRIPDYRVQRPEYLGGGKCPMVISEVLSTFQQAAENIPQGNMAGHGIGVGQSNQFKRMFFEHGFILGILSVLPKTSYQQGINRKFTRLTKFDYPFPELANTGEQTVLSRELYWTPTSTVPEYTEVFGYQSRYAEYKFENSSVHGEFRSSLNFWHMGRIFSSKPTLQTSFVQSDPTFRVFAVTTPTVDHMYINVLNKVKAIRPLPYYGTPSF